MVLKKIINVFKFLLLTLVNFAVIFAILNFYALKEVVKPYIFAKEVKQTEIVIKKSIGESKKDQELMIPKWEKRLVKKQYPVFELEVSPTDTRLIIPKIWTNVPILTMPIHSLQVDNWSDFEDQIQNELRSGVVHYPWTADAWGIGNMFITGHSSYYPWDDWRYKDVFARLNRLNIWDEYFVFYDQIKYKYKVVEKKEVNPKNVKVLEQPSNKKISTLMTCTPIGTTLRRLIIVSELVS